MDLRERIRRLSPFSSPATPPSNLPTLAARTAYDLWSETYGVEPNLFQGLEEGALLQVLPPLQARTVLDLGCGRGRIARLAAARGARRITAADQSRPMVAAAGAEPGAAPAVVADATQLPFRGQTFDVVVSALMMGHVAALGAALGEMARLLAAGGDLVISDFHPCATLRGWVRSFRSPRDGREYAIEQHAHLFADYLEHFHRLGLRLEALREPLYEGFPVAFALRARKSEG
jgi:malonyl-CoA O-methyltransferase